MGHFSIDLAKMQQIFLGGQTTWPRKLTLWLFNSELHCVACFRYGQFVDGLRARHPLIGMPPVITHRIWNRWVTHVHHTDLSRGARIGPGLLLMHRTGVIIGPTTIGENCVIHHNVTIGQRVASGDQGTPRIGDNVWIGPGATITGAITIGDNVTIAAGTILSRDVPDGCLVAGNPGRVIARDYDNSSMINFVMPDR